MPDHGSSDPAPLVAATVAAFAGLLTSFASAVAAGVTVGLLVKAIEAGVRWLLSRRK